jgi:hypothetical protein
VLRYVENVFRTRVTLLCKNSFIDRYFLLQLRAVKIKHKRLNLNYNEFSVIRQKRIYILNKKAVY